MKNRKVTTYLIICGALSASLTAFAAVSPAAGIAGKDATAAVAAATGSLPVNLKEKLFSPEAASMAVAKVNDETITVQDLKEAISALHEGVGEEKKTAKQDYAQVLNRLVNSALIIQEARNMGMEEQQDVREVIDGFANKLMREKLMTQKVKDVKADPKEVEKTYQERISQWKITSLVFKTEEDAKKFEKQLKGGKKFDQLAAKVLKDKTAEHGKDGDYIKMENMPPELIRILATMKKGSASSIVPLQTGYLLFRLDDTKHVADAATREQVEHEVQTKARMAVLEKYRDELVKKHIQQKKELIEKLDFEAKEPGFEAMLKDTTPIAEIAGEEPVTVSQLAEAMKAKFYHGIQIAIDDKKVNKSKTELLSDLLANRAIHKEARELKIDQGEEFQKKVKDYTASILFGAFIEKVVQPEIKITTEELETYYNQHITEYTYPEMYRIEAIVFTSNKDAEAAIDKLRKGMDYKWFKNNAEGRLAAGVTPNLVFEGSLVMKSQLPEDVQKMLTGVKSGEFRQYAKDNQFYVLNVMEVVPAKAQPFVEVEAPIRKLVYFEKLNKGVEGWAGKLRAASDVQIFADFK